MNLCLLRGVQSALTLSQTRARCKEIPTRTTIKIAAGPGCSYRSPAGRDERRGRRAPGPGFEKSSAVVTQGGRSFGPHSSCLKEDDRRHAGRTCRSVFSTSTNAKLLAWTGSAQIPPDPGQIYFCLNKQRHAGTSKEQLLQGLRRPAGRRREGADRAAAAASKSHRITCGDERARGISRGL